MTLSSLYAGMTMETAGGGSASRRVSAEDFSGDIPPNLAPAAFPTAVDCPRDAGRDRRGKGQARELANHREGPRRWRNPSLVVGTVRRPVREPPADGLLRLVFAVQARSDVPYRGLGVSGDLRGGIPRLGSHVVGGVGRGLGSLIGGGNGCGSRVVGGVLNGFLHVGHRGGRDR